MLEFTVVTSRGPMKIAAKSQEEALEIAERDGHVSTPNPRATLELCEKLARIEARIGHPLCLYEEEDAQLADALVALLPAIIADLRRQAELEMEAQADDAQIAALEKEVEQLRGEPGVNEERLAEVEAENARLKQDNDMGIRCLEMVREALTKFGCSHGPDSHKNTPAMMFPEWIACVICHHKAKVESDRDAGWAAADALAESIDSIQWNCGCCEDVAECANCKRCELALAAYTAARAKRTT